MRRPAALALLLAAGPGWAEGGPSAESVARLSQAIAAAGCVVTEVNQPVILKAAEMTEAEASVIVDRLIADGKVIPEGDHALRLVAEGCRA